MKSKIKSIEKDRGRRVGAGIFYGLLAMLLLTIAGTIVSFADDTDIYRPKVRHNVMIIMDSSGSMAWPIYENTIDYAGFYDYVCVNRSTWTDSYDEADSDGSSHGTDAQYYGATTPPKKERTKIYLIYANAGYSSSLTGDAGNPSLSWYINGSADMATYLNSDGELEDAEGDTPADGAAYGGRISTVVDGITGKTMITVDGVRLPNGKDIALHDWRDNADGSRVDNGFAGLVRAPGYYFSGYFYDGSGSANNWRPVTEAASCYTSDPVAAKAVSDPEKCYFFATGNYINMQMVFNLQVYAGGWKKAWEYCEYPPGVTYQTVSYNLVSKNYNANAPKNYDSNADGTVNNVIYNALSGKMRVYFSEITMYYNTTTKCDKIELYDENGNLKYTYKNKSSAFWSDWVTGKKITVRYLTYNVDATRKWKIDKYQYESIGTGGTYKFDIRIDVAKEAIIDVIETTRGKINWSLMTFDHTGNANGGTVRMPFNPSFNDDQQKQSIINQLEQIDADGGTPLGETLQDAGAYFQQKAGQIYRDCNKNFIITLTDGFASADTEWSRMLSTLNFHTNAALHDGPPHQYTLDPMQYATPTNDYYDDIAYYLFSHSFLNLTDAVPEADREDSAKNITVHNIGFSLDSPMLQHAAELQKVGTEQMGMYLTAYSKDQLISAFHTLGILIGEYTSYTAPVVSVDEANRVQSGDKLYMALFKPNQDTYWSGNLKKYGLAYGIATGCGRGKEWYVVDRTIPPKEATTCDGEMIQETSSFWSTVNDGGEVEKGGAGRKIYDSIPSSIPTPITAGIAGSIRNILTKTSGSSGLVRVATDTNTLTNADFGVGAVGDPDADMKRYKIINFLYGYTYSANDGDPLTDDDGDGVADAGPLGAPVERSSWPMGPIIHSTPKIIDYFNPDGSILKRYIAVGANDGMLHVFDDTKIPPDNDVDNGPGNEIFAFVPTAVLPVLQQFDPTLTEPKRKVYTVDSSPTLIKKSNGDLLLVFGLRRGGRAYYAINVTDPDPSQWTFAWEISNSTSGMEELGYSMPMPAPIKVRTGATYMNVLLVPGGYDTGEDRPVATAGDDYYLTADHYNTMGRGIFLVDADTGLPLDGTYFSTGSQFAWPAAGAPTGVMAHMKYCFAADPTVVSDTQGFLLAAYITDLYGQVWKLTYDSSVSKFRLNLIFKMNPMTNQQSDYARRDAFKTWVSGGTDPRGTISYISFPIVSPRKAFFSPDVSYAGNCYTDVPVLFMGTGDREHPTYIGSYSTSTDKTEKNGLYSFYDAHAYYVSNGLTYDDVNDYFTEEDLLNVTCGGMEPDVILYANVTDNSATKANMKTFLRENMKGWYMLFSQLTGCYASDNAVDFNAIANHYGEKSISPVSLFAKVVYAPTFQPLAPSTDPCAYNNVARIFAVDYCTGNAVYNFYTANETDTDSSGTIDADEKKFTRLDRYLAIGDHIPSGVSVVIRHGKAAGFISVGGKIYPLPELKMPGAMIPVYWREILQ